MTRQNERRDWLIRYAPLIIWIGVIFFLSSGAGAMSETSRFVRPILRFLFPSADEATILFYHGIIRKSAHVVEYAVLGFLAARAFAASSRDWLRAWYALAAFALAALVAATDEFQQSFNPDRTGSAFDVLIDLTGAVLAISAFTFLRRNRSEPPA